MASWTRRPEGWWPSPLGQNDLDSQAWLRVPGRDVTAMKLNRTSSDGQAQPNATALPAAISLDPKERIENGRQQLVRNTGSMIPHDNPASGIPRHERDLDRRALGRVTDRVSQNVLEGPPQQLRITPNRAIPHRVQFQATVLCLGLDQAIVDQRAEQLHRPNVVLHSRRRITFGASEMQ